MTIEQAIEQYENSERMNKELAETSVYPTAKAHYLESAEKCKQMIAWLKILKAAQFEYNEAWRIITHPTPDVRYPDIDRAKMILDVFGNSLGLLDAERRSDGENLPE